MQSRHFSTASEAWEQATPPIFPSCTAKASGFMQTAPGMPTICLTLTFQSSNNWIYWSWQANTHKLQASQASAGYQVAPRYCKQGDTILHSPLPSLQLSENSQRSLFIFLETQYLQLSLREHLQISQSSYKQSLKLQPHRAVHISIL